MRSNIKRVLKEITGTAAIEFAIIAPILIAMLGAAVEVGRIYQVYDATNRIATQYAIAYADCSDNPVGTCNTEGSTLASTGTISNIVPQLQIGQLSVVICQVTMSGTTPNIVYSFPSGVTLSPGQIAAAQAILTNGQPGVIVTATYNHTLQFFPMLATSYLGSLLTASYTAVQLKG